MINFYYDKKTITIMKRKILPPMYFLLSLILLITLYFNFSIIKFIYPPYNWIGILFIIFGITMNLWANNLFKKKGTAVNPNEKPSVLITNGPFRLSRNPMYLGMTAILLGISMISNSLITLIAPVLFITIIQILFITAEEKLLESIFNKEYLDYKEKVRRWI